MGDAERQPAPDPTPPTLAELVLQLGNAINDKARVKSLATEVGLELATLELEGAPRDWWSELLRSARDRQLLARLFERVGAQVPALRTALAMPVEWSPVAGRRQPARPGGPRDAYWDVGRERLEAEHLDRLVQQGISVVVCAPTRYGKTWYLARLDARLKALSPAPRILKIDRLVFDGTKTVTALLRRIADIVAGEAGRERVNKLWDDSSPDSSLDSILERTIGNQLTILLADLPDSVWSHPGKDAFFSLLRGWAERSDDPWRWLRVAVAYSTTPSLWLSDPTQSPTNVEADLLPDFSLADLHTLAGRSELEWTPEDCRALTACVGGHPWLTRLCMYESRWQSRPATALIPEAHTEGGIFSKHIEEVVRFLQASNAVREAFVEVAGTGKRPRWQEFQALFASGLIRPAGPERCELRYPLLEQVLPYVR